MMSKSKKKEEEAKARAKVKVKAKAAKTKSKAATTKDAPCLYNVDKFGISESLVPMNVCASVIDPHCPVLHLPSRFGNVAWLW